MEPLGENVARLNADIELRRKIINMEPLIGKKYHLRNIYWMYSAGQMISGRFAYIGPWWSVFLLLVFGLGIKHINIQAMLLRGFMKLVSRIKSLLLFIFVILFLHINKILVMIVPFARLARLYKKKGIMLHIYDYYYARRFCTCIEATCARLFWKPMCFEKALTVMALSKVFGIACSVSFGIRKDEAGAMKAHAWSEIAGVVVTGFDGKDLYTEVYRIGSYGFSQEVT